MIYYNYKSNASMSKPIEVMPYDNDASMLFREAEERYKSILFEVWQASDRNEQQRIIKALEDECNARAKEVEYRHKPIVLLPALLLQYLEQESNG